MSQPGVPYGAASPAKYVLVSREEGTDGARPPQASAAGVWVAVGLVLILGVAVAALFVALANARSIDESPSVDSVAHFEDLIAAEAGAMQKEIVQFQNAVKQQLNNLKKKVPASAPAAPTVRSQSAKPSVSKKDLAALTAHGVVQDSQLPRAQLFASSTGKNTGMSRTGVNLATLASHISQDGSQRLADHAQTAERMKARERVRREVQDTAYQAAHPEEARKRQSAVQNLKNSMHLDHSAVRAKTKEVREMNMRLQEREHDSGMYNPRNVAEYARMSEMMKEKNLHVMGRNTRSRM